MIVLKVALFILVLILALVFAYYNLEPAKLTFFRYSLEFPLFLIVLISFIVGFLISYVLSEIRSIGWRRYGERLRNGLHKLWTGYLSSAEKEFSKLIGREEIIPLYIESLREQFKTPSLYLQRYEGGIVETALAEDLHREDRERAIDLLEKAAGKNPENLRAKRLLRSLYYLNGEREKALDLQRDVLERSERVLREEEKRILGAMLADMGRVDEAEKFPPSLLSLFVLSSHEESKKRRKGIQRAFETGLQNELVLLMVERNVVNQDLMEFVEGKKEELDTLVLALLYLNLGMEERLEELKDSLPAPIKDLINKKELRECYRDLLEILKLWECSICGKEQERYIPVCGNCLNWNRLKVKRRE